LVLSYGNYESATGQFPECPGTGKMANIAKLVRDPLATLPTNIAKPCATPWQPWTKPINIVMFVVGRSYG